MKTFRQYLKEDVDVVKHIDDKNSLGFGLECQYQATTKASDQVEVSMLFGSWNAGAHTIFEKIVDESSVKAVTDKDLSAVQNVLKTVLRDAESRIKSELSKLGYKPSSI